VTVDMDARSALVLDDETLSRVFERGTASLPESLHRRVVSERLINEVEQLPLELWDIIVTGNRLTSLRHAHPQLQWFAGHFPDWPILPGVAQIHWAVEDATRLGCPPQCLQGVSKLKFIAPVYPGSLLRLEMVCEEHRIRFECRSNAGVCSRGELRYKPDDAG